MTDVKLFSDNNWTYVAVRKDCDKTWEIVQGIVSKVVDAEILPDIQAEPDPNINDVAEEHIKDVVANDDPVAEFSLADVDDSFIQNTVTVEESVEQESVIPNTATDIEERPAGTPTFTGGEYNGKTPGEILTGQGKNLAYVWLLNKIKAGDFDSDERLLCQVYSDIKTFLKEGFEGKDPKEEAAKMPDNKINGFINQHSHAYSKAVLESAAGFAGLDTWADMINASIEEKRKAVEYMITYALN